MVMKCIAHTHMPHVCSHRHHDQHIIFNRQKLVSLSLTARAIKTKLARGVECDAGKCYVEQNDIHSMPFRGLKSLFVSSIASAAFGVFEFKTVLIEIGL